MTRRNQIRNAAKMSAAERQRQQDSLWDPAYLAKVGSGAVVAKFVKEAVWHLVVIGRLPKGVTQAQLGSAFNVLLSHTDWKRVLTRTLRDAYKTIAVTRPRNKWPDPQTVVDRIQRALPVIELADPTWRAGERDALRSWLDRYHFEDFERLRSVAAARKIQSTFRAKRNNPHTSFGTRVALRRAGFDADSSYVMRAARRGVRAAPR